MIVDAERLGHFWSKDSAYLTKWVGDPSSKWFLVDEKSQKLAFIAGLASMDGQDQIGFTNGRHRARWLLNAGLHEVPLCIPPYELDAWVDNGLIIQTKQPIIFTKTFKFF